eukprot:CAMPEP_0204205620 /NCGR_PEP_ID=MMETSP0361-20130328/70463_1 /ASSEMBLY_ACC=CAM_ASM_000343 /TAXON_ID=268821 /ORGANISM="Scrippsiella Hangoei, Strain SHTV-5" /LENGTH=74 /DNA_ID=CAMNT_0051168901 /DNA_START=62 /DNA_END=283 /DNA_ORIENTATION=-
MDATKGMSRVVSRLANSSCHSPNQIRRRVASAERPVVEEALGMLLVDVAHSCTSDEVEVCWARGCMLGKLCPTA